MKSSIDWLRIGVANYFGQDKTLWDERLLWFFTHEHELEAIAGDADKYYLYVKSVHAYREVMKGEPTKFIMDLDACSSGISILSASMGCRIGCENTNLLPTGERRDIYTTGLKVMNDLLGSDNAIERDIIKEAIMTAFYGSRANPKRLFGEDTPELKAFYDMLVIVAPGAWEMMQIIQRCWNPEATEYRWKMADGYQVVTPVTDVFSQKLEIPDVGAYTYNTTIKCTKDFGVSLAANITQSIEGSICRELIRMCNIDGFNIMTIFDSFWCSPNHVEQMRANYNHIMLTVHKGKMMEDILRQITNTNNTLVQKEDLGDEFMNAEYSLS